jgi:acyl carrier protein
MLVFLREELLAQGDQIPAELPADADLAEDLGISSFDRMEFVANLEYHFDFVVPDEDLDALRTLDAISAYALARLSS